MRVSIGIQVPSVVLSAVAVAVAAGVPSGARAEIVQCAAEVCSRRFDIGFNGVDLGFGQLVYNSRTGEIALDTNTDPGLTNGALNTNAPGLIWDLGNGSNVTVGSLGGNADPWLSFAVGSTTGATGGAFSFTFNLPIALSGEIVAGSSLGYSLTAAPGGTAQITPFGSLVLEALDVDFNGPGGGVLTQDKGVDVGTAASVTDLDGFGETATFNFASLPSFFTLGSTYDLMTVRLSYILTPNSSVALSGVVSQEVVPLPAALPLLVTGLLGLGLARGRKSAVPAAG